MTVDQLWYTWSLVGLEAVSGFQIRAASAGLSDLRMERVRALAPFLLYQLPEDADPYRIEVAFAPISLLFSNSAAPDDSPRYILAQRRYRRTDRQSRPGNYFVHVLASLPPDFGAREAIALWRSHIWKGDDGELGENDLELPQVSMDQLHPGAASPSLGADRASDLAFLIHAFLTTSDNQRIYVAAPPDTVAAFIRALTRSLPRGLTQRLTFNTYERNLRDARERLVGTCLIADNPDSETAARLLPDWCYSAGAALNCYTGQRSQLPEDTAASFATYAARHVSGRADEAEELARLLATAEALRVSEVTPLLALFLGSGDGRLERDHLEAILASADLAGELLAKHGVRQQLIHQINSDGQWWEMRGKPLLAALRDSAEDPQRAQLRSRLSLLAQDSVPTIRAGIEGSDSQTTATWRGVLQATLPRGQTVAEFLLAAFPEQASRASSNPQLWDYLMRALARETPDIAISRIQRWLAISWAEVEALLSLPLPESWKTAALGQLISATHEHAPESALSAVARHQPEFQMALNGLMQHSDTWQSGVFFLAWLGRNQYPGFMDISQALLRAAQGQPTIEDALLGVSVQTLRASDRVTLLLQNPRTALDLLRRPEFQREIVTLSLDDAWWSAHGQPALAALQAYVSRVSKSADTTGLNGLANEAVSNLRDALARRKDGATFRLLALLRVIAPPASSGPFWTRLQRDLAHASNQATSRRYSWPARQQLLLLLDAVRPPIAPDKVLPWLQAQWDEVGDLLQLDIAPGWRELAVRDLVTSGSAAITGSVLTTILATQRQTDLFVETLRKLLSTAQGRQSVQAMFVALQECSEEDRARLFLSLFRDPTEVATAILEQIAVMLTDALALAAPACERLLLQRFAKPDFHCSVGDYVLLVYYLNTLSLQDAQRPSASLLFERASVQGHAVPEQLRTTLLAMKQSYALLQAAPAESVGGIRARLARLTNIRHAVTALGRARRSRSPLSRRERAAIMRSLPNLPRHMQEEARAGLVRRLGNVQYRSVKHLERDIETLRRGRQGMFGELVEAILAARDDGKRHSGRQTAPYVFLILRHVEEPKWASSAPRRLALALRGVDESAYQWLDEQVAHAIERKRLPTKALPLWRRARARDTETGSTPIDAIDTVIPPSALPIEAIDTFIPPSALPIEAIDTVIPPGAPLRKNSAPTTDGAPIQKPASVARTSTPAPQPPNTPQTQAPQPASPGSRRKWLPGFLRRSSPRRDG